MTCQPDWHEIFAKCKNNPEKNIIFNKKKLVQNFDFYWCYLRNALWFGIVRLNHEEPLKFAPFLPHSFGKTAPFLAPYFSSIAPFWNVAPMHEVSISNFGKFRFLHMTSRLSQYLKNKTFYSQNMAKRAMNLVTKKDHNKCKISYI